ncbi:DUF1810 domain-containing protein [Devosia sp. ZB163]|uniref:DUF1810 domain-containing protein n=1 Tax=Devosia sp. ZB163 TaxID=3025938 RepID=UPI002362912F|nr:DUF1810 domain-containing protein [Devosia sp. ZB163]MDC9822933.1 DUF1810 domain-containing protein [Devosia sp. ZB163]
MFEDFVAAQDRVLPDVLAELRAGRKASHWMWFIFPQLTALGRSDTARRFGISGLAEAKAYLAHPVLGPRLIGCTGIVNGVAGRTAHEIFGVPDDLKFRSSMTLFGRAADDPAPFRLALAKYYGGEEDPLTVELLERADGSPGQARG